MTGSRRQSFPSSRQDRVRYLDAERMALFATTPFIDMLAHWKHFLRHRGQRLNFAIGQAACKSTLAAIHETSCFWKDAAALEKMGFTLSGLVATEIYVRTRPSGFLMPLS